MQTLQLAQRLIPKWNIRDLGNLPADSALALLDCINGAIQELYALAPVIYRQGEISAVLGAPIPVNLTVTAGSNAFTGYTATASQFGATVTISGDSDNNDNLIIPPMGLQDTYQGASGTWPSVIYGDVVPLPADIETMIDEPQLIGHLPRLFKRDFYSNGVRGWGGFFGDGLNAGPIRQIGRPRSYWVEPNVACQNGTPMFFIRLDPLPDQLYRIRFRALFYPVRLALTDLQTNTLVPVNEAWIERLFIPLILQRMSGSDLWKGGDVKVVMMNADEARKGIELLRPQFEKPNSRVRTPPGY